MASKTTPAKISRPRLDAVYPRTRLFELLDGFASAPVTWISAPAGAGKTLLADSYLRERSLPGIWYQLDEGDADAATFFYYLGLAAQAARSRKRGALPLLRPEHQAGLNTFTRHFFDRFCDAVGAPMVIVLDNYQELPSDAPVHGLLGDALAALHDGVRLLVLSRDEPPAALVRWRAQGAVQTIGWDALQLTPDEAEGIVASRVGHGQESPEALHLLFERAQGWAAGLVLLLEQLHVSGQLVPDDTGAEEGLVFDYFAHELYQRTDADVQGFLMRTALLPAFTLHMARQLTGRARPERVVQRLVRGNLFTTRLGGNPARYQYHPLFRQFLMDRLNETLPAAELASLQGEAAILLLDAGTWEDAVDLLHESGDEEQLANLIEQQAESLLTQGRFRTVLDWIGRLSEATVAQHPWVRYWHGAAMMYVSAPDARDSFRKALNCFEAKGEAAGAYLSCAAAAEVCFLTWDDFHPLDDSLEQLLGLRERFPEYPSPRVEMRVIIMMAQALMVRDPFHPDLPAWTARLNRLLEQPSAVLEGLMASYVEFIYFFLRGDLGGMRMIMNALRPLAERLDLPPVVRIFWLVNASQEAYYDLDYARSLRLAKEGLAISAATGMHSRDNCMWDASFKAALNAGDLPRAREYLERLQPSNWPTTHAYTHRYYRNAAQLEYFSGELELAQQNIEFCQHHSNVLGFTFHAIDCSIGLSAILAARGAWREAARQLAWLSRACRRMDNPYLLYLTLLCRAELALRRERPGLAAYLLRQAFPLARRHRLLYIEWWTPEGLGRLCALALAEGIEPNFARELIEKYRLLPPEHTPAAWPWPVRVRLLGVPKVERDGEPLRFSGKAQNKPLDLLKALVAFGTRDVSVDVLCDELWPDSDGDAAQSAFGVTLHRLRKLVGQETLLLSERRLSLNPRQVWLDSRALEAALENSRRALATGNVQRAQQDLLSARRLYQGPFASDETHLPILVAERERLHDLFASTVEAVTCALHSAGMAPAPETEALQQALAG